MKMHRKAMKRHSQHVEACIVTPRYASDCSEPFQIGHYFGGGYTSLLTLTRAEALDLFIALGVMLRYEDDPAAQIATDDWADVHRNLKRAIARDTQ